MAGEVSGFPEGLSLEEKQDYLRTRNLKVTAVNGRVALAAREDFPDDSPFEVLDDGEEIGLSEEDYDQMCAEGFA